MSARNTILAAVRRNLPQPPVALPDVSSPRPRVVSSLGYHEHLTKLPEVRLDQHCEQFALSDFRQQLEAMGGRSFEVTGPDAAQKKLAELFPNAKVICSATPELTGNRKIDTTTDPHSLNDVDVGIARSRLGVAEAGAVWLTQDDLVVDALGVLSQHLIVLLDPDAIVCNLHDVYHRLDLTASPYGLFMAGPSATGDIEGVIIHGAQGARSLTVFLTGTLGEGSIH